MKTIRKQQSLAEIYDEYYPKLYAYVLVRTKQKERAEDIVQRTFEKAIKHLHTFKPKRGATIGSWLFTIAKHTLIDEGKKESRVQLIEDSAMERLAPIVDGAHTILIEQEDNEEEKAKLSRMWKVIKTLSPEEQEVIQLKYVAGLSYKDIEALTNVKPNTLAQLLRRALKKCQKAL